MDWHKRHKNELTLGQRAADGLRNAMGSWVFVFGFLAFMSGWMLLNLVRFDRHWDQYPFILLNLMLSTLAGLQGAILLIAAKRADEISAALAKHDYETNVRAEREIAFNNELTQQIHYLTAEIHDILKENSNGLLREDRRFGSRFDGLPPVDGQSESSSNE